MVFVSFSYFFLCVIFVSHNLLVFRMTKMMTCRLLCMSRRDCCRGKALVSFASFNRHVRSGLPWSEVLTTFLHQHFRRLLPMVSLKPSIASVSSTCSSEIWRYSRHVNLMSAASAVRRSFLPSQSECFDVFVHVS